MNSDLYSKYQDLLFIKASIIKSEKIITDSEQRFCLIAAINSIIIYIVLFVPATAVLLVTAYASKYSNGHHNVAMTIVTISYLGVVAITIDSIVSFRDEGYPVHKNMMCELVIFAPIYLLVISVFFFIALKTFWFIIFFPLIIFTRLIEECEKDMNSEEPMDYRTLRFLSAIMPWLYIFRTTRTFLSLSKQLKKLRHAIDNAHEIFLAAASRLLIPVLEELGAGTLEQIKIELKKQIKLPEDAGLVWALENSSAVTVITLDSGESLYRANRVNKGTNIITVTLEEG